MKNYNRIIDAEQKKIDKCNKLIAEREANTQEAVMLLKSHLYVVKREIKDEELGGHYEAAIEYLKCQFGEINEKQIRNILIKVGFIPFSYMFTFIIILFFVLFYMLIILLISLDWHTAIIVVSAIVYICAYICIIAHILCSQFRFYRN